MKRHEFTYLLITLGSFMYALASEVMFYVDSGSGGTDIIALIIKNFPISRSAKHFC